MDGGEPVDRFDFDDQATLDKEVRPKGVADGYPPIFDVDGLLPLDGQPGASESCGEQHLVAGFQQTGARVAMDREPAFDCQRRQFFKVGHVRLPSRSRRRSDLQISTQRRNDATMPSPVRGVFKKTRRPNSNIG
jgi:hypothetical protein